MKSIRISLYSTVLALVAFTACKRETPDSGPTQRFEEYFPLQPGAWRIYQVDSIGRPTPQNQNDTLIYQVREVIDSAYLDGTGKKMYKIFRYRRNTDQDPWILHQIFAAGIQGNEAIQQDGNIRYVKLIFPVSVGRTWNANIYNEEDKIYDLQRSKYIDVHKPATIEGNTFDSTAFVELNNEEIAIYSDYKIERYAAGVGLIEFQHDSVTTQNKSFWIHKRIVSFGR